MAFVNYSAREINVKIVYYGPGLGGKTTNLKYIHQRAPGRQKGQLISLATQTERTLFFDFLPLNLGTLRGFQVRFHLYTVPGQVFYAASRKLILKGVDGVVFVADSDPLRVDANAESWADLGRNLAGYGLRRDRVPTVIQYNKRDLPGALTVDQLRAVLGRPGLPEFEAVATQGVGVFDTLKGVARLVLAELARRPPGR
ncbi:GTP-binding protein [Deferrisoma palaeochoriense]